MMRKLLASSLCLLIGACVATRPMATGPSGSQDLSKYVLVIESTADGRATHAWKPARDFDQTKYRTTRHVRTDEDPVLRVSLDAAECERQYNVCVPECQASTRIHQVDKYVYDTGQYGPWRTGKWSYCRTACMKQLANCQGEANREPVRFESVDPAVDWLKRHRGELAVGAVVVIAGVTFFVASCSGGIVLLVPVLLFAEAVP